MTEAPPSFEELMHYGVKGMRWGTRKTSGDLSKFSNQETVLRKGSKVQNLSPNAPRNLDRPIYVSHTPKDNLNYRGQFSLLLIERRNATSIYENTFVAKKDIKIPSERQSVDAFMTLYRKNPKQLLEDVASSQYDLEATQRVWGTAKGRKYYDLAVSKEAKRLAKQGEAFVTSPEGHHTLSGILVKDVATRDNYFQEIAKRGFDAVVDEHDRQTGGEQPLIILNGKNVLASGKTKSLTEDDINLALLRHQEKYG